MVSSLRYAPPMPFHFSLFVYPYGGTNNADGFLAVHHFLTVGAVLGHDLFVSVTK